MAQPASQTCLFLSEWEAARAQSHNRLKISAEAKLLDLQSRVRTALASLEAWMAVVATRRKLEEATSIAALKALDELDARWRPQRLELIDGDIAGWLATWERANAEETRARASRWSAAVPSGAEELQRLHQVLGDALWGSVASAVRDWDQSHGVATQAWFEHDGRLKAASRAIEQEQPPPDVWLSEVRYREVARNHLQLQAVTEQALNEAQKRMESLETQRASFWTAFSSAYCEAANRGQLSGPMSEVCQGTEPMPGETLLSVKHDRLRGPPPLSFPRFGQPDVPSPDPLPDMPSASGAILLRNKAFMKAPPGFLGFGGGGWLDGATLVITLHGYAHLFAGVSSCSSRSRSKATDGCTTSGTQESDAAPAGYPNPPGEGDSGVPPEDELVEAAIKASVYLPMATKCIFLRKGKEFTLDLAEGEDTVAPSSASNSASSDTQAGGAQAALRKLLRRDAVPHPVPRRLCAKISDESAFSELEKMCHDFVRRGQHLRKHRS